MLLQFESIVKFFFWKFFSSPGPIKRPLWGRVGRDLEGAPVPRFTSLRGKALHLSRNVLSIFYLIYTFIGMSSGPCTSTLAAHSIHFLTCRNSWLIDSHLPANHLPIFSFCRVSFDGIFCHFIPVDSFWYALQLWYSVCDDRVKRSATNSRKLRESSAIFQSLWTLETICGWTPSLIELSLKEFW